MSLSTPGDTEAAERALLSCDNVDRLMFLKQNSMILDLNSQRDCVFT